MKNLLAKAAVLIAAGTLSSHAIFGIGGHWAVTPGYAVEGSNGAVYDTTVGGQQAGINLIQGKVEGLNGFGVKLWVDAIPFVDVEATANFQWGMYDASFATFGFPQNDTVNLEYQTDFPFADKAEPTFGKLDLEGSVLYPFLKLPPMVGIAKFYAGAGITYTLSTAVLDNEFAAEALEGKIGAVNPSDEASIQKVTQLLTEAIIEEGLLQGIGFHVMAGTRVKPPIIPLAIYANVKYAMLGGLVDGADSEALTFELGGGLAF